MENFYIGQTFENDYPMEAAVWCNDNEATIIRNEEGFYEIIDLKAQTPSVEEQMLEYQLYLDDTDWYVVRYSETGVEIPEEIRQKRQEARNKINELRGE